MAPWLCAHEQIETPDTQESVVFNLRKLSKMSQCRNMAVDGLYCLKWLHTSLKRLLGVLKESPSSIASKLWVARPYSVKLDSHASFSKVFPPPPKLSQGDFSPHRSVSV